MITAEVVTTSGDPRAGEPGRDRLGEKELKGLVSGLACASALVITLAALTVVSTSASAQACLPPSVQVVGDVPSSVGLDPEQRANARAIVGAVVARRLPTRAAVIAVATALQESDLRNIPYGDMDSLGLFQQRPSAGWGAPDRIMDPLRSTNTFLDRLTDVPDWSALPLTVVAQRVQRSAFPDAYAKWEGTATQVVSGLLGRPGESDDGSSVVDTPGLLAIGVGGIGSFLPRTFQGGPVTIDLTPRQTAVDVLARVRHDPALPGTLLIGISPENGSAKSVKALPAQMRSILDWTGSSRTVYWLTPPEQDATTTALRKVAARDRRVRLFDVAAVVATRPSWADRTGLTEAGIPGIAHLVTDALGVDTAIEPTTDPACADGLGGYSTVPVPDCAFSLARPNPRACRDAIRWALSRMDGPAVWHNRCLHFVARAYGWDASGIPDAATFWATAAERHPADPAPPAGALVFWDTGHADGHVALSAGNGLVISNDIGGDGTIAAVSLATITARWHATYLGWTPPLFGHGL